MSSFFHKWFLAHPRQQGETYFQHMGVALCIGARLYIASNFAVIHALVPGVDLFQTVYNTTSKEYIGSIIDTIARSNTSKTKNL